MPALLWLLTLIPAICGGLLTVLGTRRMRVVERLAGAAAVIVATGTLDDAIVVAVGRPRTRAPFLDGLPAGLGVDGLSAALTVTVAATTLLVLLYAAAELGGDADEARARFFGLMLLFSAAMQLTVTATTLPLLLVGWEVMGATSYALIGFWWRDAHRAGSATTAFLTTRAADLGLYVAAGAALAGLPSGSAGELGALAGASGGWRDVIAAGIVLAAAGKSAQLPFSFWLSRAMDGPSPVSALLHSATMVAAGGYLLLRTAPLLHATGWAAPTVAWLGAATAVLLGVVAIAQSDLKQLLAASTCAQVGFMVLAAGTGAVAGGTVQLVAHAATKALLFICAGVWLTALGTRQLSALRGAARRWPRIGVPFAIGALGLAGVPPLALWAAKDAALSGAADHNPPLYLAGLVAAGLSAVYSARAVAVLWAPPDPAADYDTKQRGTRRVPAAVVGPVMVLAAAAVVLVVPGLPPVADRLEPGAPSFVSPTGLATSGVLAVLVTAAVGGVVWRRPRPSGARVRPVWTAAATWWGLEAATHAVVVRPVLRLADSCAWFDDHVIDAGVGWVVAGVRVAVRGASRVGEVEVDDVVAGVATGARRLGAAARRPQTGQLHQYYAQAAIALAAALVLLLVVR